jgi:O-antigen biosynthesis protein WbqP
MKRATDLFLSIVLLLICSPLFFIISLMIKITSPGDVLFKQLRVGKGKKNFEIYKFRTMHSKTPRDVPTHLLCQPEKFITPVGKFLRKTSLDELPQLFNILKGEMSFIGPRPALYNQEDLIQERDRYGVHSILPGITGWAQVNGRDELSIRDKAIFDRFYLENKSILLDLWIMILTMYKVLFAKGLKEGTNKMSDGEFCRLNQGNTISRVEEGSKAEAMK